MASSAATGRRIQRQPKPQLKTARNWVRGLGKIFQRVALFQIDGTLARIVALKGLPRGPIGDSVSLIDQTPLRWAVEAASPIVGAGRSPGAIIIPAALGVPTPRAFAVIPLVVNSKLVALAYADNGNKPLPVSNVGELFDFCSQVLDGKPQPQKSVSRAGIRSTARRPGGNRFRPPGLQRQRRVSNDERGFDFIRLDEPGDTTVASRETIANAIADALHQLAKDPGTQTGVAGSVLQAMAAPMPAAAPAPAPVRALRVPPPPPPEAIEESLATVVDTTPEPELSDPGFAEAELIEPGFVEAELVEPAFVAPEPVEPDDATLSIAAIEALAAGVAGEFEESVIEPATPPSAKTVPPPMVPGAESFMPEIPAPALIVPAPNPPRAEPLPAPIEQSNPLEPYFEEMTVDGPAGEPIYVKLPPNLVVTPQGIRTKTDVARQRRPINWKVVGAALSAGLMTLLIAALTAMAPAGDVQGDRITEILPNSTLSEIADQLEAEGLINSPRGFRLIARLSGVDRELRAGTYRLPTGVWAFTVLSELHAGQVHTKTVTVPEGATLREIAVLLEKAGLASSARLIKQARNPELLRQYRIAAPSVEGFLFPETYTFAEGLSEREILSAMLDEFFDRLRSVAAADGLTREAIFDRVILASIIEREAGDASERQRIAGVFQNRIDRNMRLESCATVQYILQRPKARLRHADLRIESPYNTYLNEGLPPGPIANPGVSAIAAAFAPEEHEFLFFVSREDGTKRHVFTKSYAAHEAVLAKIRKRR